MTLRFRYRHQRVTRAVVPLGGRWVRPRPIVTVGVVGPLRTLPVDAILDTAADDTVLPERVAQFVGVDLSNAPVESGSGVGGDTAAVRYAQVLLRLTDGNEFR